MAVCYRDSLNIILAGLAAVHYSSSRRLAVSRQSKPTSPSVVQGHCSKSRRQALPRGKPRCSRTFTWALLVHGAGRVCKWLCDKGRSWRVLLIQREFQTLSDAFSQKLSSLSFDCHGCYFLCFYTLTSMTTHHPETHTSSLPSLPLAQFLYSP